MIERLYFTPIEKIGHLLSWAFKDSVEDRYEVSTGEYLQKRALADYARRTKQAEECYKRTNYKPSFYDVVQDNLARFTFFGFLERLIVVRQTSLVNSFHAIKTVDTLSSNFVLTQGGTFSRGMFKGNLLNAVQFLGTYGQALLLSNKNLATFAGAAITLDALFHPLDTIRVRWTADTRGVYSSLADVAAKTSPAQLFNGIVYKLIFSGILAAYFTNLSSKTSWDLTSIALLTAAYPFLTLKSIAQVSNTRGFTPFGTNDLISAERGTHLVKTLYRGFIPFLALNMLAPYAFPQLWSQKKVQTVFETDTKWLEHVVEIANGQH